MGSDIAWDGESDAFKTTGFGNYGRIDANHPAVEIQQRPPAVTRVDGRVGL